MNEDTTYKVSAKRPDTGKYWTYGNLKKNQWGNWSLGMKVTPELIKLLESKDGGYVNFSLFADDEKREVPTEAKEGIKKLNTPVFDDSDTVPF